MQIQQSVAKQWPAETLSRAEATLPPPPKPPSDGRIFPATASQPGHVQLHRETSKRQRNFFAEGPQEQGPVETPPPGARGSAWLHARLEEKNKAKNEDPWGGREFLHALKSILGDGLLLGQQGFKVVE